MKSSRPLLSLAQLAAAALCLHMAGPVRADYASDHPEYFSITAPPPAGGMLAPTFGVPDRVVLHPGNGGIFPALMGHLAPLPATLLHAGQEDRKQIEEMLTAASLSPDSFEWLDFEQLNSTSAGEYFPLLLQSPTGLRLVDPRYLLNRPYDDAAGSKLAAAFSTCAWRPPTFLTRGFIDTDGNGTCVVSSKLHSKSYPLTAAEISGILKFYLGCKQVVVLESLNFDPEGRLDTFFRYGLADKVFVGQYEVAQDSANVGTLKDNAKALDAALPEGTTVQPVPLPTPVQVGDTTIRPSYLAFLQLPEAVLIPVFGEDTEHEAEALAIFKQTWPSLAQIPIDGTTLALSGSRLTGVVGAIPEGEWDTTCTPPEVLCESPKPADCPVCWSECSVGDKTCLHVKSAATCKLGDDGCYDFVEIPCTNDDTCKDGKCIPPPSICDDMPPGGVCEGDVAMKCTGGSLLTVDCQKEGKFCSVNAQDQVECITPCPVACTPGTARCDADQAGLLVCSLGEDDCPKESPQPCPAGTSCKDGACAASAEPDGPDTSGGQDSTDSDALSPPADEGGFYGGYGKKDDGCTTSPAASNGGRGWLPGLLLLGLLVAWRRRSLLRARAMLRPLCLALLAFLAACQTGAVTPPWDGYLPPDAGDVASATDVQADTGDDTLRLPDVPARTLASIGTHLEPDTVAAGEQAVVTCRGYDPAGNYVPAGPCSVEVPEAVQLQGKVVSTVKAGQYEIRCVPDPALDVALIPATLTVTPGPPVTFSVEMSPVKEVYVVGNTVSFKASAKDSLGNPYPEWPIATVVVSPPSLGQVKGNKVTFVAEGSGGITVSPTSDPAHNVLFGVTVDAGPPVISISYPKRGTALTAPGPILVEGFATDSTGINKVLLNGKTVEIGPGGSFESLLAPAFGLNLLVLEAEDVLGNKSRLVESFLFSKSYYPVLAPDVTKGMVPEGIVTWLDYDAFTAENGPDGTSLSYVAQEFLLAIDLASLIPSPVAQQSILGCTYDVYLKNLKYGDPLIKVWPIPDGITLHIEFPDLEADLEAPAAFCPDVTGKVTASSLTIDALASVAIGPDGKLAVDLLSVNAQFLGLDIKLYGMTGAVLGAFLSFFKDTLTTMVEEQFETEIKAQFESQFEKLLGNVYIDQPMSLPPFMPGSPSTNAAIHLRPSSLTTAYAGLEARLNASFTAMDKKKLGIPGSIARSGCLSGPETPAAVDGKHYLELALHLDVLNQTVFAKYLAGGVDFVTDAEKMAAMGTDISEMGVENLMVIGHSLIPPVLTDCYPDGQLRLQLGDLETDISLTMLGMPLEMTLYIYLIAKANLTLVGSPGDQAIEFTFGEVERVEFHLASVNDEWKGNETLFASLIEETFLPQLLGTIQNYPYVVPISQMPIGDLMPAFANWTFVPVVDSIEHREGQLFVRAHLVLDQ